MKFSLRIEENILKSLLAVSMNQLYPYWALKLNKYCWMKYLPSILFGRLRLSAHIFLPLFTGCNFPSFLLPFNICERYSQISFRILETALAFLFFVLLLAIINGLNDYLVEFWMKGWTKSPMIIFPVLTRKLRSICSSCHSVKKRLALLYRATSSEREFLK